MKVTIELQKEEYTDPAFRPCSCCGAEILHAEYLSEGMIYPSHGILLSDVVFKGRTPYGRTFKTSTFTSHDGSVYHIGELI